MSADLAVPSVLFLLVLFAGVVVVAVGVVVVLLAATRRPNYSNNPNLRPCPDCGRFISVRATTCPQCGGPVKGV